MFRLLFTCVLLALPLLAATVRLYLTDGTYHIVREYEVKPDRVRFYSIERSQWEEIPLDLIDLKRTEAEIEEQEEARREEMEWLEAEERAERAQAREIRSVPAETGVYLVEGGALRAMSQAELNVVTDKKRSVLKVITPIPVVAGKRTVELDGEHSANVVSTPTPEFYIRLHREERFGIIRLAPKERARLVQKWSIVPMTNEIFEEHDEVEIFRRQVGYSLYKIWPEQPLKPGEYAVMEYTAGEGNIQAWDFTYRPAEGSAKD